jgi:hypothetical protein
MLSLMMVALSAGHMPDNCGSYLYQPAYCINDVKLGPARPYVPQPGDIMLATDGNIFWTIAHILGGTSHPHHSAIVFARPDGSPAILEGGPFDTAWIKTDCAIPHLQRYEDRGLVWIRQRKVPLTPEQSACLTNFALKQEGKWFAVGRLGQQLTPFRARGPFKTAYVGKPHGPDRFSYYCAELVVEAMVAGGMVSPAVARPAATYPRDIFMDHSLNPFIDKNFKLCDCWYPPARFTACPTSVEGDVPSAPPAAVPQVPPTAVPITAIGGSN